MTRGHSGSRVLMRTLELLGYRMGSTADKPSGDVVYRPLRLAIMELAQRSLGRAPDTPPPPWEVTGLQVAVARYLRWVGPAPRWGWKLPETYLVGGHVAAALPQARFVELVRDGRDLAFKYHRTDRLDQRLGRRLLGEIGALDQPHHIQAARSWAFQVDRFEALREKLADRVLTIKFEQLCSRPLEIAERLCTFLGVDMVEECREYLGSKVKRTLIGSHRHEPPDQVAEVERAVGSTLARHGYALRGDGATAGARVPPIEAGDDRSAGVFLTGATSCLGRAVLRRLLDAGEVGPIYLLLRDREGASAERRFSRLVSSVAQERSPDAAVSRLRLVSGDLAQAGLGISKDARAHLLGEVERIVHLAECSAEEAPADEIQAINVGGAHAVLELASELCDAGRLARLDFRSTAYVAGTRPGVVTEEDLERGQSFANLYERTKYDAERAVRARMKRLPVTIHRPSTLLDPRTHRLLPMVLLSHNLPGILRPGRDAWLDLLPVERAADAMVAIMRSRESLGRCFHIVAGRDGDIRVRDLLQRMPAPRDHLASYLIFDRVADTTLSRFFPSRNLEARRRARRYGEYLRGRAVRFDASKTRRRLEALGVTLAAG